jgi:HAE1 family hydrophobic/amphiphilic exporter-1
MSRRNPLAHSLPRFSVTRPVTVIMILCAILVLGFIANSRIPVALFPAGMEENNLGIFANYRNASATDIEEKIARPIEDMVGTVSGVKEVNSYISAGRAFVRVTFQSDTDLQTAYADLRDRMDRLMPEMPDDLEEINVRRWDENDIPMMYLVLNLPEGIEDKGHMLETLIEPTFRRVEGVGNVDSWGVRRKEIQIELIDDRLRSHRIDPNQLMSTLQSQNLSLPNGYIMEGGSKVYVRSVGRFASAEEIRNLIIDPVHRLTLGDIANVYYGSDKSEHVYRIDGAPAIGVEITRESSGNIEAISRGIIAAIQELAEDPKLKGLRYEVFWDQGKHVRESIDNLKSTGLWGGLFAAIVIFSFLRAPRMTGILTLAIPLSLLCTVIAIYFMDWTLNMATMMGLLLSVGLVVDNAIVIVENIYRKRQSGTPAIEAAITGAGEVGLAVTMATLTTVVVFLPLILMSDKAEFSFWMLRIGIPVVISLLASLFIALVFIPLATKHFSRGAHHDEPKSIVWIRGHYRGALAWVLAHRIEASLIVLIIFSTIAIPISEVKQSSEGGGGNNENNLRLYYDTPTGNTLEETTAFMSTAEQFILSHRDLYNIEAVESSYRRSGGRIQGRFKDNEPTEWYEVVWHNIMVATGRSQDPLTKAEIIEHMNKNFQLPPGVTTKSSRYGSSSEGEQGRVSISLYGDDTATLITLGEEARYRMASIDGVVSVETSMDRGGDELKVVINRERALELGVNPRDVSGAISYSMRGRDVGKFYTPDGREVDIEVEVENVDEQGIDDLKSMTFPAENGREIPLESVAALKVEKTLGQIRRQNRQTTITISALVARSAVTAVYEQVDSVMAGFEMPRGYRWDKGVRFIRLKESNDAQMFAMILSVTFVFLLMGVLFESFILPLAVIISVPFSFLGVYWALYITDSEMGMMSMIGMVILIGIVVNNAIVLVDLTNRLREEGMDRMKALVQAGEQRLRPILMTTCTTIFGLLPMALGNSKMIGMPYSPMGRAMIGGLITSTLLTLIVVPLFYVLLDDLRAFAGKVARSALSRRSTKAELPVASVAPRDSSA